MNASSAPIVVGAGISGIACARVLQSAGFDVAVHDRGRVVGGRMASRRLRETGTPFDGRVVDIGASYFTVTDPDFAAVVDEWERAGIVRPWASGFHVAGPDGIVGVSGGPVRYAAPGGLRSLVTALAEGLADVHLQSEIARVEVADDAVRVDDRTVPFAAVCMPWPQAARIVAGLDEDPIVWEPVIAVTCVYGRRTWIELDGVFVNDDPVLTWIADDGRRRGDDAPVLVAHVHPVLAARHLADPASVIPAALAAIQRVLGIEALPDWVDAHRWTYAKPLAARSEDYWRSGPLGMAGDAWAEGPKVEAAWLSGHRLGVAFAQEFAR